MKLIVLHQSKYQTKFLRGLLMSVQTVVLADCPIKRNPDGTMDITVYRKPTNTGRYLNFHSCHSSATKQGFIKGLFLRAERLCSTPDLLKTEMERIYSELLNNSYPKKFIDRVKTRIRNQAPLERH